MSSNLFTIIIVAIILIELPLPFIFSNKFSFTEFIFWGSSLMILAAILLIIISNTIDKEKRINQIQNNNYIEPKLFEIKKMILITIIAFSIYYLIYNIFTKTNVLDNSVIIFLPNFLWIILMLGYIGTLWYKRKFESY
jgi:hypothetical protein